MVKKVLIVGGAGYIGSQTNKLLAGSGLKTVVFDNLCAGHRRLVKWGDFVKGDLARPADLARCFKKHKFSAVIHFAAFAAVGESVADPAKYYRNNVANTINLLDAMRAAGVKNLVFSSSCSVYGVPARVPITEAAPLCPISPYGRTKLIMEQAIADYARAYGLKYAALRYFNAAGADPDGQTGELHNPETHIIPLVLDAAAGRRPYVSVFGTDYKTPDGTCLRDYVHTADLAQAHLLALRYLERGGANAAFNVGNGKGFSVMQVIKATEKVTGLKVPRKLVRRRPGDPAVLVASSAAARRTLGWKPAYADIETIIEHAWAWHKKQRHGK
jgi:UDP-glucose 4-epimerase